MKTKTHLKAGSLTTNHNETLVVKPAPSLRIKSGLKAGSGGIIQGPVNNHNETLVHSLKVRTHVNAGLRYAQNATF
jgi:hypothetical protein